MVARGFSFGVFASWFTYGLVWLGMMTVYQAIALRRFYGQSWWLTIAKAVAVTFIYFQVLDFAMSATVGLTLWRM